MREGAFPIIAALLVAAFAGWLCGAIHVGSKIKQEAVCAGAAYYTNDASGSAQFKWKECK